MGVHQLGREDSVGQHRPRAVQIGEQGVQQLGPLGQPHLERGPVLRRQNERERVEPPRGPRFPRTAVGDAVVTEEPVDVAVHPAQLRSGDLEGARGDAPPGRPQGAVGVDDLVVAPGAASNVGWPTAEA